MDVQIQAAMQKGTILFLRAQPHVLSSTYPFDPNYISYRHIYLLRHKLSAPVSDDVVLYSNESLPATDHLSHQEYGTQDR